MEAEATFCTHYQIVVFSPTLLLIFQAQVYFPLFLEELKINIASCFILL